MNGEPFVGSPGDIRIILEAVSVFNDMDILHPHAFGSTQNCADILRLKDIFQQDGEISGAVDDFFYDHLKATLVQEL